MLLYRLKQNKIITITAFILLLISSLFTYFLFNKIYYTKLSRLTFSNEILRNEKNFSLYKEDICIGKILIKSNNNNDNLILNTTGNLNIIVNKTPLDLNLTGFVQFNSLWQMVNLNAELRTNLNSLFFKIAGLKEIIISLSSKNPSKNIFLHTIPGPLVLEILNDQYFGFNLNNTPIASLNTQLANYKLPSEFINFKEQDCQIDPNKYLNVDALTEKFENLLKINYE